MASAAKFEGEPTAFIAMNITKTHSIQGLITLEQPLVKVISNIVDDEYITFARILL